QAEDGIRDRNVTGVQTCALPIFNDEVIRSSAPVFDEESVIFVSPADTVPAHVRGTDPANPMRPFDTYFRTPATTGIGGVAGRYLADEQRAQHVVIADDGGDEIEEL